MSAAPEDGVVVGPGALCPNLAPVVVERAALNTSKVDGMNWKSYFSTPNGPFLPEVNVKMSSWQLKSRMVE